MITFLHENRNRFSFFYTYHKSFCRPLYKMLPALSRKKSGVPRAHRLGNYLLLMES